MPRDPWTIGPVLGIVSALATSVLILVLRPLLARYALARPNARSSHRVPTPQGGGMAIVAVTIAVTIIAVATCSSLGFDRALWIVLAATALLAVIGAADDIIVLRAMPRLACQFAAAIAVVLCLPDGMRVVAVLPAPLEHAVLVLAIVWFVNLFNFMDGIDWITVAEVLPVVGGITALAAMGDAPPIAFVISVVLGGATLGFAPFNRPVARLFLGDVGSLPIGLLLAWMLVLVAGSGHVVAALLLPLYYLADATITLGRRLARHERVWEAHRSHYYKRATDRGFSVIMIVRRIFAVNLALAALALFSVVEPAPVIQVGCLIAGAGVVVGLLKHLTVERR